MAARRMNRKPTYDELSQHVRALEQELDEIRREQDALARSESRLREAEQIALLGHW